MLFAGAIKNIFKNNFWGIFKIRDCKVFDGEFKICYNVYIDESLASKGF
jgi:hypothetical protein